MSAYVCLALLAGAVVMGLLVEIGRTLLKWIFVLLTCPFRHLCIQDIATPINLTANSAATSLRSLVTPEVCGKI